MAEDPQINDWLNQANEDLEHVKRDLTIEDRFFSHLCFHLEQAAEKFLKAYIVSFNLSFEATHDLLKLLEICKSKNPSLTEIYDACNELNPYYVDTRYPVHWPVGYQKEDVVSGIEAVEKIKSALGF